MITTIKNMLVGQTQRVHVKCYGQDNANSPGPSQIVDPSVPIVVQVVNATATAVVDPADNRAIVVTALAAGAGSIRLTESPGLGGTGVQDLAFTITAPPPDNRRIDVLSSDDPV